MNYSMMLNKRVVLQSLTETPDGAGGFSSSWQAVVTLWANVTPISGNSASMGGAESFRFMQLQNSQLMRITIRYREDVTATMRVVMGSRVFNIRRVINKHEKNEILELIAEEGVAI